jgi:uncharacterized protein with HEPN domain
LQRILAAWARRPLFLGNIDLREQASSEDFKRNHKDIPWKKIGGMRDILIHAYDFIDLEVRNSATVSIPN